MMGAEQRKSEAQRDERGDQMGGQHYAEERGPTFVSHVPLQRGQGPLFPQHLPPVFHHPAGPAGPVSYTHLLYNGILGERTLLGHCIHVSPAELDIIKETGTMVVNNPESNMGNAIGICPVSYTHLDVYNRQV